MRTGTRIREMLDRIQGEFHERPGLRLTSEQAQRLWQMEPWACEAILAALVDARVLSRGPDGSFVRNPKD